jgi:hypothetical protein
VIPISAERMYSARTSHLFSGAITGFRCTMESMSLPNAKLKPEISDPIACDANHSLWKKQDGRIQRMK